MLPILLPIGLIVLKSVGDSPASVCQGQAADLIGFVVTGGSLLVGVGLACSAEQLNREMLSASGWVGEAVVPAAMIFVVTGAAAVWRGDQAVGIAADVEGMLGNAPLGIWLPILRPLH